MSRVKVIVLALAGLGLLGAVAVGWRSWFQVYLTKPLTTRPANRTPWSPWRITWPTTQKAWTFADGKVEPAVYEALADDPNGGALVFVALSPVQLENWTPSEQEKCNHKTRERVLSKLSPGDFKLGVVFAHGIVFTGTINSAGVKKLAEQVEVRGIELDHGVEEPDGPPKRPYRIGG